MQNSDPLVWYGIVVIVVMSGLIMIPYLRGKADLCTAWNLLLLGVIIFVGFGCLEVKYGDFSWPQLKWFQPTPALVNWCMLANTVFLATLVLSYYYNPITPHITSRVLRKWPPITSGSMMFGLIFCVGLATASLVLKDVFFVGLVLSQLSHKALVCSAVFAIAIWWRTRTSLIWLSTFVVVLIWAMLFSMVVFAGRRLLLSVLMGPVLCVFWMSVRYWNIKRSMSLMAVATVFIFLAGVFYNSIRHFDQGKDAQKRTIGNMLKQVSSLKDRKFEKVRENKLHYLGQWNVNYSLLAEHYVHTGELVPRPLNTLKFVLAYPIPRSVWPGKPIAIGEIMVHDIVRYKTTNWGVGIAGHGIFEGGIPALILYAVLLSIGIRLFDDPMRAQPDNPYLISMLAAASPHIVSFPRGDMGTMTLESLECFLFAFMVSVATRFVYGTARGTPLRPSGLARRTFISEAHAG